MLDDVSSDTMPRDSVMISDKTMALVMCALGIELARTALDPGREGDLDLFADDEDDELRQRDRRIICQLMHYGLPKEAVVNLLRLPVVRQNAQDTTLHYRYFQDEVRTVRIVLTDVSLPQHLTRTRDGLAIVSLAGTRAEVWTTDGVVLQQVRAFLQARLGFYQIDPVGESGAEGTVVIR